MPKFYDRKVILQAIETVEGVDQAPVVATDAILTRNYSPRFLEAETRTRQTDLPYFGARPQQMISPQRGATFEVEMAGAGAAITVPAWMKLNRLAGFDAGTVVSTTHVIQKPISSGIVSATHAAYIDNLLMKATGCRATMGIRIADDDYPFFTYDVRGRAPSTLATEATPGTPVVTAYKDPLLVSTENTTFSLDGYALPLRSLDIDVNADLAYRSLVGPADRVTWRNRAMSGRIMAELPDLTAKNYFQNILAGTTMPLSVIHGVGVGNIVEVAAPRLQITGVDVPEEDGILMLALDFILQPTSAGNDELTLTSR